MTTLLVIFILNVRIVFVRSYVDFLLEFLVNVGR